MKTTSLFFALCFGLTVAVQAQNVPNGNFENWTTYTGSSSAGPFSYELPDGWKTTDSISMAFTFGFTHSVVKESSEIQSGSFAMKLTGWSALGSPAPAAASNGDIDISTLTIVKGTPDTVRHATLNGHYRFAPVGGDTCYIMVSLLKWNTTSNQRDTIAYGQFQTDQATSGTVYSPFEVTLGYRSAINPDTMVMLITTSPLMLGSGHAGTVMYVDNIFFSGVVGIDEVSSIFKDIRVYPTPAKEVLHIRAELKSPAQITYRIYDLNGRIMTSDLLEPLETAVDIRQFPAGNYSLQLTDDSNNKLYSTQFPVIR